MITDPDLVHRVGADIRKARTWLRRWWCGRRYHHSGDWEVIADDIGRPIVGNCSRCGRVATFDMTTRSIEWWE